MIDINYAVIDVMEELTEIEVTNLDFEILRWFHKITKARKPKGITIANLDGDDNTWYGFTITRLGLDIPMVALYLDACNEGESYFDKFKELGLVKIYRKRDMDKLLNDIDDLFEDEFEDGMEEEMIFFRFTKLQEKILFDADGIKFCNFD